MGRALVVCALLAGLVPAALGPDHVVAKDGSALFISPDSGELGTAVVLGSVYWVPDAEVRVYAAFSETLYGGGGAAVRHEPERWWGPVAVTRSGPADPTYGTWQVTIAIEPSDTMPIPRTPGFVLFRAETEGLLPFQAAGNETNFAVAVNGERPNGAGGIRLTVSVASGIDDEPFLYSYAPAGANYFGYFAAGALYANRDAPYRATITRLTNGDYDLLVLPVLTGDRAREIIGKGSFALTEARLCMRPDPCDTPLEEFLVKRVRVREGEMTTVEVVLGRPGEAPPLEIVPAGAPAAGAGPSGLGSGALLRWASAAAAAGAALMLVGWKLRRLT